MPAWKLEDSNSFGLRVIWASKNSKYPTHFEFNKKILEERKRREKKARGGGWIWQKISHVLFMVEGVSSPHHKPRIYRGRGSQNRPTRSLQTTPFLIAFLPSIDFWTFGAFLRDPLPIIVFVCAKRCDIISCSYFFFLQSKNK